MNTVDKFKSLPKHDKRWIKAAGIGAAGLVAGVATTGVVSTAALVVSGVASGYAIGTLVINTPNNAPKPRGATRVLRKPGPVEGETVPIDDEGDVITDKDYYNPP